MVAGVLGMWKCALSEEDTLHRSILVCAVTFAPAGRPAIPLNASQMKTYTAKVSVCVFFHRHFLIIKGSYS